METKDIAVKGRVLACPVEWTVDRAIKAIRSWYCLQGGGIAVEGNRVPVPGDKLISSLTGTLAFVDYKSRAGVLAAGCRGLVGAKDNVTTSSVPNEDASDESSRDSGASEPDHDNYGRQLRSASRRATNTSTHHVQSESVYADEEYELRWQGERDEEYELRLQGERDLQEWYARRNGHLLLSEENIDRHCRNTTTATATAKLLQAAVDGLSTRHLRAA
eukprot:gene20715-24803_t